MIALYMRLSRADGDLEGEGAVSNSIANQRAILRSFVERDPGLSCQPVEEFVDDGFSGSSFDRPEVQRMLALCKEGRVSCIIVKDLSRFAREYIDAGTYIEQVFPFLRVRFVSIAESYDSAACSLDSAAPGIAMRNIANAAYCRDTSIRVRSALQTKWRRGLRPHPTPPFGYMVDPADRMRLAPDERFAPGVRRLFELAAELADPKLVAAALDADGIETPGVAYRRLGLYGYGKRPEPKSRRWTGTQVQKIVGDPVYTGTLVTGKTRRRVMNRHPVDVVPESERYVTEGAHPALVGDGLWRAAQACLRTREHLKGVGKSAPKSPFARLRPSDVQNLRGRALWLGKPREKPTRKGADMGTALLWLAAGYALGAASAAMALAAWAVLRTSSECSRAEEAAMLPPASSGFRGGDPS